MVFLSFCLASKASADEPVDYKKLIYPEKSYVIKKEARVEKLESFLKDFDSPMSKYSFEFIYIADKYNIDWRLLAAISGVESTFGKHMINGTYNAYGWGGGVIKFTSWEDSIETVSKALSEKYYSRGLNTPKKISPVYCPPNPAWYKNVELLMNKIENYDTGDKKEKYNEILKLTVLLDAKTANN